MVAGWIDLYQRGAQRLDSPIHGQPAITSEDPPRELHAKRTALIRDCPAKRRRKTLATLAPHLLRWAR